MLFNTPEISVIMPVYNTEKYLNEAIDSILNQTFVNFEFIIIDDASTDNSLEIIKSYNDKRIIIIENEVNKGYVHGLNLGISMARGKYIARMDSDDISLPSRLSKQYEFLIINPGISLLGTNFEFINSTKTTNIACEHDIIKSKMLLENQFAHPSVMLKLDFLKVNNLNYDEKMVPSEDYDLWWTIIEFGGKVANISEILLKYRLHETQISEKKREQQILNANKVKEKILKKLLDEDDIYILKKITFENCIKKNFYYNVKINLQKISKENELKKIFNDDEINLFIKQKELEIRIEILNYYKKNKFLSGFLLLYEQPELVKKMGLLRFLNFTINNLC
jgi:glycosyltransferase involved in cell wall biosynthesis